MFSVYFETFGCQMNVADSQLLAESLAYQGYSTTTDPFSAHLVIVNTCSVRAKAEQRARARITELVAHKRNREQGQELWVIGCMAQRVGEALKKEIPGVDRVIGARDIENLQEHVEEFLARREQQTTHISGPGAVSAFVPVMRGCNNYCTYCIVPYVRGPEYSVPTHEILETVHRLVDKGTVEITLLGQNVNSYRDPGGAPDFPSLLAQLDKLDGLRRIRFTTSHPKDCSPALIECFAHLPRLCSHLHLPIQSGSNSVLEAMNRRYTREHYLDLIDQVRSIKPDIDLTTDVMVGFPGETTADFEQTLALFSKVRFTNAFMFAYSPRPGTQAAALPQPPQAKAEAAARLSALIAMQSAITREIYENSVGKTVEVLFTARQDKRDREWIGQTFGAQRALFACDDELAGSILPVRVARSSGQTLLCERI